MRIDKKRQSSQYDKIFKENIEAVIPNLMQKMLGITAVHSEELPDDIQHTKERKPDVLKKITDIQGNIFIIQIEFQVVDELQMAHRMADYYLMLDRKYELPIEQFVIYLGNSKPKMSNKLIRKHLTFEFSILNFSDFNFQIFLKSDKPEEVLLGVLANFENEAPENVIKQIITRISETSQDGLTLQKYFNQLRILAQLRNLELKLKNAMDSIANYINEERDVLYLRGLDKGVERFVVYLLQEGNRSLDQIATIAGVSVEFVLSIKQKLSKK